MHTRKESACNTFCWSKDEEDEVEEYEEEEEETSGTSVPRKRKTTEEREGEHSGRSGC